MPDTPIPPEAVAITFDPATLLTPAEQAELSEGLERLARDRLAQRYAFEEGAAREASRAPSAPDPVWERWLVGHHYASPRATFDAGWNAALAAQKEAPDV